MLRISIDIINCCMCDLIVMPYKYIIIVSSQKKLLSLIVRIWTCNFFNELQIDNPEGLLTFGLLLEKLLNSHTICTQIKVGLFYVTPKCTLVHDTANSGECSSP